MDLKNLVTAGLIMSLATVVAHAEITLQVDENIKVTAINGQSIDQSAFQPLKTSFELQPGKHVITAKYDRLYDLRKDVHDYLRSGNVTVVAEMLQDNQTYRLVMPGQPEAYQDARDFAKNPSLAVEYQGQILAQAQGAESSGGLLSGITGAIGGIFNGDDAQKANQQAIAAIDSTPAVSQAQQPVLSSANTTTLDQFMGLWLKATPDEREKIRQWVAE